MATNKHYMKVFLADEVGSYVINYDGDFIGVGTSADQLANGMGHNIKEQMDIMSENNTEAIYGFRIDYTVTPIRTDPFK